MLVFCVSFTIRHFCQSCDRFFSFRLFKLRKKKNIYIYFNDAYLRAGDKVAWGQALYVVGRVSRTHCLRHRWPSAVAAAAAVLLLMMMMMYDDVRGTVSSGGRDECVRERGRRRIHEMFSPSSTREYTRSHL